MRVVRQVDERTAAVWDDWKGQQPKPFDYGGTAAGSVYVIDIGDTRQSIGFYITDNRIFSS